MRALKFYLILAISITLGFWVILNSTACTPQETAPPSIAFYHWKNQFNLSPTQKKYLNQLPAKTLYLRFFDIDWDTQSNQPIPVSTITIGTETDNEIETETDLVPTVFITNRTLLNISSSDIPTLANRIYKKITELEKYFPNAQIKELQIDCDWTRTSQENYFLLLEYLKKDWSDQSRKVSATIRLHQLKYADRTGVPPVDRGALMCYNVGEVNQWSTTNSILDPQVTRQYLNHLKPYPLPLDIALPLFSWGVLFRDGELIRLLNQLDESELVDDHFYIKTAQNRYEVRHSTYLHGHYLYPGDQIRLETSQQEDLEIVARQLHQALPVEKDRQLIFYQLDSLTMVRFSVFDLQKIQSIFNK